MVSGAVPVDYGIGSPSTILLVELFHQVTHEEKDDVRVGIRLTQCDVTITIVNEGEDKRNPGLP